ncbi:hypothetical protein E1264_03465 [Actinomadura sp. KC216]|uniref:hypothetical protein n=1 Tax=Actinomadura sp. KC216 TaxID=2530370 RepID=UPI001050D76C|nr:hypothetical protein [Actinomadura sp. KC216]TDB90898.1 hypothetical protein E1264_03465 [Actinomadura sp. KC216]
MDVAEVMDSIESSLTGLFSQMEIAEEEIELAQKRHGEPLLLRDTDGRPVNMDEMGPIWHSFRLLGPDPDRGFPERMETELLYRQHCAELLDRVAEGLDTRAATGAELVIALSEASMVAPLTSSGAGLYLKLMTRYFPETLGASFEEVGLEVKDYQKLHGQQMEQDELFLRKKLRQDWRVQK